MVSALLLLAGCRAPKASWTGPLLAAPRLNAEWVAPLSQAEAYYAEGLRQQDASDPQCIESFFRCAADVRLQFPQLGDSSVQHQGVKNRAADSRARDLHNSSLLMLIQAAQRFHLIDGALNIQSTGGAPIPLHRHGFSWKAPDFNRFELVGKYHLAEISRPHRRGGWGVPLVIVRKKRNDDRFYVENQTFPATLTTAVSGADRSKVTLQLFDPLNGEPLHTEDSTPMARDVTAPLVLLAMRSRNFAKAGFVRPGTEEAPSQLVLLEPYRPGRIPIVLIHGLRSEPRTWLELANDLRGHDEFNRRYQLWFFRYPSGEPFVRSAAALRRELKAAVALIAGENDGQGPPEVVLVGHSMGGLVAKLQATSSSDHLWAATANRPIGALNATAELKSELREMFYFEPLPFVSRVVFIATPHRGSGWANRAIGRLGATLVRPADDRRERFRQLIAANPGTFSRFVSRRLPTSIDLLRKGNPYLLAMEKLEFASHVQLHSIIGTGRRMVSGPADGVVPVSSARHTGVASETFIDAHHSELHRRSETTAEVLRILRTYRGASPPAG